MSSSKDRPTFTGDILNDLPVLSGTCQEDRLAQALRPDWFHLEERGVASLLAMSRQYASKLCFHTAQDVKRGDWTALFQQDESAVMADFLNFESKNAEEDFLRILELNPERAAEKILQLAELLEDWLGRLSRLDSRRAEALMTHLGTAAGRLVKELDNLQNFLLAHRKTRQEPISCRCPHLRSRIWQDCRSSSADVSGTHHVDNIRAVLLRCHSAFHQVISHLRAIAPALWEESLHSGYHEPAIGLLIAFLQLYGKALAKGRSFPERHLDFYYWDVLRAGARLPQPDSVHLVCRNVTGQEALIHQGDRFTAGSDAAGDERLYLAENDLHVTDVRVDRLFSVSFERNKFVSPAWEMGCFTRCRSRDLSAAAEPQSNSEPAGLPIFGKKEELVSSHSSQNVQLGLMLAAPELLLSQGRRKISVILLYKQESDQDDLLQQMEKTVDQEHFFFLFGRFLNLHLTRTTEQNISESVRDRLLRAAKTVGIAPASVEVIDRLLYESNQGNTLFYRFLTNAFHISLSGASGWLPVARYLIFPVADAEPGCSGGLRLSFVLDQDVEPVIGCRPELHGAAYNDTSLPLLRLRLNHQANFFTYSIFRHFILKKIILETKTEGLRDLQAYNQHGRLDPTQPFQPFGPAPARQSYFIVGSHEAACKQLTALNFCIEWAELPDEPEGFAAHYRQYNDANLNNASFRAKFSLLRNGRWVPEAKEQRHSAALFAWRSMDGRLKERQDLTVRNLKGFQPISAATAAGDFFYGLKQSNGFFRWELAGPKQAFGHSQYPELLSRVLVLNARSKRLKLPVPNAPYTPLIKHLSLNYTARCEIDLSKAPDGAARLYHIHPFGMEILYPQTVRKHHAVVPQIDAAGNLYIGLRSQDIIGVQTFYFHLNADSDRAAADASPRISWFYAADTEWRPLEESRLLADTTEHFLHSGIITLNIPDDISSENAEMGHGLYWLRASTDSRPNFFSSVRGVYAQALRATAPQSDKTAEPLAPQKIRRSFSSITGLAEVFQPEASFNGGRQENREAVITRMSERLRHKDRAATPWDYERLVLEQFSQIRQVKCFPHLRTMPEAGHCPGSVLVVTVPEAARQMSGAVLPKTDPAMLAQIRNFLQRHASPFSRIEVRNPEYEQIQVRCAVAFSDRSSSGAQITQLNQAVIDYISPWTSTGFNARFGWSLRLDDILAYLSGLEGVEYVTDLSVLHITKDASNAYYLADSVRDTDAQDDRIRPRYPWSIAVPMQQHFIRPLNEVTDMAAEETGINELQIGETFIINE
jgi:hypothetical protein